MCCCLFASFQLLTHEVLVTWLSLKGRDYFLYGALLMLCQVPLKSNAKCIAQPYVCKHEKLQLMSVWALSPATLSWAICYVKIQIELGC